MYYVEGIPTRQDFGRYESRSVPVDRIDDYTSQRLAEYASSIYEANRRTLDPVVIRLTRALLRAYSPITGLATRSVWP